MLLATFALRSLACDWETVFLGEKQLFCASFDRLQWSGDGKKPSKNVGQMGVDGHAFTALMVGNP